MNDIYSCESVAQAPLGKACRYIDHYTPSLLFPIARQDKRREIGIEGAPPFVGADIWTAFEVSWLNQRGKPQVAIANITIPCESPNIIESKSLKLYLNSLNNSIFQDSNSVRLIIQNDLVHAAWGSLPSIDQEEKPSSLVSVQLLPPEKFNNLAISELKGLSLDRLDIDCTFYTPAAKLLKIKEQEPPIEEVLVSHLLKSNCLVTGQPDWASVQISYSGAPIDQEGLLQYLVSFRNHNEFHEQCVERIFMDIWRHCKPTRLTVYARYTRRGGIDINPFRTSHPQALPTNARTARQ